MVYDLISKVHIASSGSSPGCFCELYCKTPLILHFVYWQWYGPFNTAEADIIHVNRNLGLAEVLRFAEEKRVRLFAWLYSVDVDKKLRAGVLDNVFAMYEKLGLGGVKSDFMDWDDQICNAALIEKVREVWY